MDAAELFGEFVWFVDLRPRKERLLLRRVNDRDVVNDRDAFPRDISSLERRRACSFILRRNSVRSARSRSDVASRDIMRLRCGGRGTRFTDQSTKVRAAQAEREVVGRSKGGGG